MCIYGNVYRTKKKELWVQHSSEAGKAFADRNATGRPSWKNMGISMENIYTSIGLESP